MGIRADREGIVARDFHTAQQVLKASGGIKNTEPSNRYYLADAAFLVGLEGDDLTLLQSIHAALRDPVWPLYLGRKAFVPGEPVWREDGLQPDTDLRAALATVSLATAPRSKTALTNCVWCWKMNRAAKSVPTNRFPSPSAASPLVASKPQFIPLPGGDQ